MNTHTEATALAHHGIAPLTATADERTDLARDFGVIFLCLGCGNVTGIDPVPYDNDFDRDAARQTHRETLNLSDIDCCPDSDTIVY